MRRRRTLAIWLAFALVIVLGFAAWKIARTSAEPSYGGKPLSVWFREYSGARQILPPPVIVPQVVAVTSNRVFLVVSNRLVSVTSNQLPVYFPRGWPTAGRPASVPATDSISPLTAFDAIGSNAAPFLAAQMRLTAWDRFYERNYTNLPAALQKRLPSPGDRWSRRSRAIEIAQRLGSAAHDTSPALLKLLREGDIRLASTLPRALKSVRADRADVAAVILHFSARTNHAEVFRLVGEFGVSDPGVARLLGKMLAGPQTRLHRDAIRLLENSGARAAPATPEIIGALTHPDAEVRYLAARALEQIAQSIPADARTDFERLLRDAQADPSVMVSNVTRRILLRMQTETGLSGPTG